MISFLIEYMYVITFVLIGMILLSLVGILLVMNKMEKDTKEYINKLLYLYITKK